MDRDIRRTSLYREVEALYGALRKPCKDEVSDATDIDAAPDGRQVVFAGTIVDGHEGIPPSRICAVDLGTGCLKVLSSGPNVDRLPKYSNDGRRVAFLSDRQRLGDFQLYLLDLTSGEVHRAPSVDGWVEYFHWSPDGARILLGVAGHGADFAGAQGSAASTEACAEVPVWMPIVEAGEEGCRWRRVWIYECATDRVWRVGDDGANIWEAAWCGDRAVAAVCSPGPAEGLWYSARLEIIELETENRREVFTPEDQLGWPAASPSGKYLAIVEGVCSDRWLVAGQLRLIDTVSGKIKLIETAGVDITYAEWRSSDRLLLAGHRGFETLVCAYDVISDAFTEVWSSQDITTGGRFITISGLDEESRNNCVLIGENFLRAPEIAAIREGQYVAVRSFDLGYSKHVDVIKSVERIAWMAPDGLEIQGWLLSPRAVHPHPVVMNVHGGPVWHWRPTWLGRAGLHILMLVAKGYAVFFPNPRGSAGRGQDFVRRVKGDLNGKDTYDYLSGLDSLVSRGVADPTRIGVMGLSYGGNMTSWLITQDSRFAAAVPVSPHTNQITQYLLSNIPQFISLFLSDTYNNPDGKCFDRSPVMHAHKAKTPTLNVCGALDRCTPAEEAIQFHRALQENGVTSVLVIYPEEGHGVRKFPAVIDYATRVVAWMQEHMPVGT